jgi:AraC family transcriptional regulator
MFVLQRRLQLAAQYMRKTDKCLADIALRCGFCDQAHFSRRFKDSTGFTPAAWRRAFSIGETRSESPEAYATSSARSGHYLGSTECLSH